MFRMTLRRRPWLLLTLLACSTWLSAAANSAVPAGYQFNGVGDTFTANLADTSPTRQRYDTRVMAVATAVNSQGQVIGFWKQSDGQFRSHSFRKATNPAFSILDTPDFVSLTASDVSCWMFFTALICPNDNAFGIRIVPPAVEGDPVTGFTAQITPNDAALIAGSMPLMLNPGNFSSENAAGVIATTQVSADSQFGVIVHAGGQIALPAVPWLIAINDLTEPLLLAYDGDDGDCLVYGEGCSDDDDWCEDRDGKRHHGHGRGHEEHGNGNGYGHDDCTCGGSGTSRSLLRAGGIPIDLSGGGGGDDTHIVVPETAAAGALLLRLNADASLVAYRFPAQADGHAVTHLFPLAINFNRAVLRGDIQNGSRLLDKRLLSCQLDPAALDANDDGIVDCVGGMTVIGGTANSIRAGTVLGFELNDSGRLIGNDGYNAAGVGAPFVVDLGATSSAATPLADLITGADNWEINTVTDINASGRITGYGYRDCSASPDAFFIDETGTAPASPLRFLRGTFESPARLASSATLRIQPQIRGGSGNYEFRVERRAPSDDAWTLHSDWSTRIPSWAARGYEGAMCFRVSVRDRAAPAESRSEIVRYAVGDTEGVGGVDPILPSNNDTPWYRLGPVNSGVLLLIGLLGWRRRNRSGSHKC